MKGKIPFYATKKGEILKGNEIPSRGRLKSSREFCFLGYLFPGQAPYFIGEDQEVFRLKHGKNQKQWAETAAFKTWLKERKKLFSCF